MWMEPMSLTSEAFRRPLDFIRLDHDRQLALSDWLIEVDMSRPPKPFLPEFELVLRFLKEDMPLHHRDEEDDLYPMLRRRCHPADQVEMILAELSQDHATEGFLRQHIIMDLAVISKGREPESAPRLFDDLRCFAEGQKRHLEWENEVVLPLADRRLTKEDLLRLGRNLALRRGMGFSI